MRTAAKLSLFLACALALTSCGAFRKIQSSTRTQEEWERRIQETVRQELTVQLDSFRHDLTEIEWTRREYYEPQPDTTGTAAKEPGTPGPLKSEETLTIRKESQAGTQETTQETRDSAVVATDSGKLDVKTETKEEPAKDPQRFRYIFYIIIAVAVIALAVFIYVKIHGGGWFKKITSFFRRL